MPHRILFATTGSLGDLHPCLALALELRRRGHAVAIASAEFYRRKVESAGVEFRPMRPHWNMDDGALVRRCENLKTGVEVLYRELLLPELPGAYSDLLAAARDFDLLIAGELALAAPLVAEKLGLPWASLILSPCSFLSAHDPSVLVNVPWLTHLRRAGWPVYRAALNACRLATRHWWNPVRRLRRAQGLRAACDPLFADKFAPDLVLALFPACLAQPQPDWPRSVAQPGFLHCDRGAESGAIAPELDAFLSAGEPPIVFTLGSTAVHNPGSFYEASLAAAKQLGRRAVLLGEPAARLAPTPDVLGLGYAPYSQVFPRAAVIVHQGGSGTVGQALRAGRPMLVVPYGWDQPDNAARVERLGVGLSVARSRYSMENATAALRRLLSEPRFARTAAQVGAKLQEQDGLGQACSAVEAFLGKMHVQEPDRLFSGFPRFPPAARR